MCCEPGDVYGRIRSHKFVFSYNAGFIRGDLPISQESHMQATRRDGELCDSSEWMEHLALGPSH